MKSNQFPGKFLAPKLLLLTLVYVFISTLNGCKKDHPVSSPQASEKLPAANLLPDEDETEYTMAQYQDALNDVVYDGNRLVFKNFSHFVTTALALDSLGDSTANNWFGAWGFNNSLYDEFEQALDNAPEDAE